MSLYPEMRSPPWLALLSAFSSGTPAQHTNTISSTHIGNHGNNSSCISWREGAGGRERGGGAGCKERGMRAGERGGEAGCRE